MGKGQNSKTQKIKNLVVGEQLPIDKSEEKTYRALVHRIESKSTKRFKFFKKITHAGHYMVERLTDSIEAKQKMLFTRDEVLNILNGYGIDDKSFNL